MFVAAVVLAALWAAVSAVGRAIAAYPIPAALIGVGVLVGLIAGGVSLHRRRVERAAEEYRIREQQHALAVAQSQEIARYHAMNPREFEEALAFLCARDGCQQVAVTGKAGDLGADVVAYSPDGRKIVLQAKRYGPTTKVGSPDLQRFGGTCFTTHSAAVAAVVTTSTFTTSAVEYATPMGIRLLDGSGLAAWATRTGPAPWH